jgi:LPXTG-motif cell wall-anchored protein
MAPALKTGPDHEHPVIAWAGILAVLAAMLLILWARFEVHGTRDLEDALSENRAPAAPGRHKPSPGGDRSRDEVELDEAVAAGRWAAGFSP